jgi:putative transposase
MNGQKPSPNRRSPRLPGFDYRSAGAYFITICTAHRHCYFGQVDRSTVILTPLGELTAACWQETPTHFPAVELDEHVVMPNHVHLLFWLKPSTSHPLRSPRPSVALAPRWPALWPA